MMKLEIAGQTINYRNTVDLSRRIQARLDAVRTRRIAAEEASKSLRVQEKTLEHFLGGKNTSPAESAAKEAANG